AINPFNIKNKELSDEEIDERLKHYDIPTDLPLVVQVSRFDCWKDPEGVIEAFKLARKEVDATLVLLGNFASDDPEGASIYESLLECRDERILILPNGDDTALVNTLQRRAAVVVQKSIREGFGLTVAEAMWKGTPVIGSDAGGIRDQIEDGVNGFLVRDVEECARRIVQLLRDEKLRREMGERARESVRERFAVHFDHHIIRAADDQQRRRLHFGQSRAGKIGTAAARHDCADALGMLRRRDERRASAGARSEIADAQSAHAWVACCPIGR